VRAPPLFRRKSWDSLCDFREQPILKAMRDYIAAACLGIFTAGFLSLLWVSSDYGLNRPRHPQSEARRVYPLNNHGTNTYITDVEATGLGLLFCSLIAAFGSALAVVTKGNRPPDGKLPTGLDDPSRKQYLVGLAACGCYLAIITIWGHQIAAFAVSRGIILSLG
jgi:hypothetical protein